MRDIRSAEQRFKRAHARYGGWTELLDNGLLRKSLREGVEQGYRFDLRATDEGYESVAVPTEKDDALQYVGWSFYLDESGTIRGTPYGRANGYAVADKRDPCVTLAMTPQAVELRDGWRGPDRGSTSSMGRGAAWKLVPCETARFPLIAS